MASLPLLESERLRLRPRCREDIDAILEMDLDPEVYRYSEVGPPSVSKPDRAKLRKSIRLQILSDTPRNFWVIEWKGQAGLLGVVGLSPSPIGSDALSYRLVKNAWGQGIATEAASAVLEHSFRTLKRTVISAISHQQNTQSHRVLGKIGMIPTGIATPRETSVLFCGAATRSKNNFTNVVSTARGNLFICYRLEREVFFSGLASAVS